MVKFPTDEGLIFILCDDFRHEGNGKMSIFGVYGDTMMVAQPLAQERVALPSLGLYIAFKDGVGKFQMSIELIAPDNVVLIPGGTVQPVEKQSVGWMNVALKLSPFEGVFGEYDIEISLQDEGGGKKKYTRLFTISRPPAIQVSRVVH